MTLTATIQAQLQGSYNRQVGITLASYQFNQHPLASLSVAFEDGNIDGLFANKIYLSDPTTGLVIPASGAQNLDLNGLLSDVSAENLALVKVKGILLWSRPTNLHDIIVGNATNPFVGWFGAGSHTETVVPGAIMLHVHPGAGWTVTPGTADILKLANAGAADVAADLAIFGTSA